MFVLEDYAERDDRLLQEEARQYRAFLCKRLTEVGGLTDRFLDELELRCMGTFWCSADGYRSLVDKAAQLATVYQRMQQVLLHALELGGRTRRWRHEDLGPEELACIVAAGRPSTAVTALRIDFLLAEGEPQIIEVNTDNPGGFTDMLLWYEYLRARRGHAVRAGAEAGLATLRGGLVGALRHAYGVHRTAHREHAWPVSLRDARVAVAYEDDVDSLAFAHVVAAALREEGLSATVAHASAFELQDSRLRCATEQVHILLRDWLFFEMFEGETGETSRLKPHMQTFVDASHSGAALVLNPFADRLVFSKGLLVELKHGGLLSLDDEERALIARLIPETAYGGDEVWKPLTKYGGQGVSIGGVRQRRIAAEPIGMRYRRRGGVPSAVTPLYVVYALLLYVGADGYQPGGLFARIGPDPVVNVARGAQVLPILIR